MIIFIWLLALSATVFCDDRPNVSRTSRIQQHVVGKAAVFNEMNSVTFHLKLGELFYEHQLDDAWRQIRKYCISAGLPHEKDDNNKIIPRGMRHRNSEPLHQTSTFIENMKIIEELFTDTAKTHPITSTKPIKEFFHEIYASFIFASGEYLEQFIKIGPVDCLSWRTLTFNITYPNVIAYGNQLEVWDAGKVDMVDKTYEYYQIPFNVISDAGVFYAYDTRSCLIQDYLVLCHADVVTVMKKCAPNNIRECEIKHVNLLPRKTYVRQMPYFSLVISPFNNFARRKAPDPKSIIYRVKRNRMTYFKLGPNDHISFEDGTELGNSTNGKLFYSVQMDYDAGNFGDNSIHTKSPLDDSLTNNDTKHLNVATKETQHWVQIPCGKPRFELLDCLKVLAFILCVLIGMLLFFVVASLVCMVILDLLALSCTRFTDSLRFVTKFLRKFPDF